MKYVKLFDTHSEYETYINDEPILPNMSFCKDVQDGHYNPWIETKIVAKIDVTSTSSATQIMSNNAISQFSEIEIDGVVQSSVVATYTFVTTGEHTIKYTLSDPTVIGSSAFYGCSNLTSVTIGGSVTTINTNAFNGCTGLTSIAIPDSVRIIDINAFSGCTGLTSIIIGSGVIAIGNLAFSSCTGLTNITVDPNNTTYDSRNNCNAIIETTTNKLIKGSKNTVIPNTVTSIGNEAFSSYTGLTSITIPSSVTSIGNNAFYQCTGLTGTLTIPNSVTSIGSYAFYGCSGLTSVTIGTGVTSIGQRAFYGCTGLTSITSLATTAPTITSDTFRNVKTGGTLYVPAGSTGYDVWMGTGNYYLGKYNWTKVEQ